MSEFYDIMKKDSLMLKFLLGSVYDTLPSPANLCLWGKTADPSCKLCGKPANLQHVLSSCSIGLASGRYRWRHDKVLAVIVENLEAARKDTKVHKTVQFIKFVSSGGGSRCRSDTGLFATAADWQLSADLRGHIPIPQDVLCTTLRPDIVMWSASTKQLVMIELTVPWEERIEDAYERKKAKYQELVEESKDKGWKVWCLPVEVGCRGFPGQSLWR